LKGAPEYVSEFCTNYESHDGSQDMG
jgi:magnesium-transporting ATPase (P-type)